MTPTAKVLPTFDVDKAGLAKQLARKGKAFAVVELIQNAWDENATAVHITLEKLSPGKVRLTVEDDNPEGFADLSHAYTLFAESAKKADATKRGRFNLGEKLVIAMCDEATIQTTKGTIVFGSKGRAHFAKKRPQGSVFIGTMKMTAADIDEIESVVATLIPPANITTTYNMADLPQRKPIRTFAATLRTERADEDGNLKATTRKTTVELYDPLPGEVATIYELGIPVVETGDRYHVNVMQKVPLNMDRDNVPPAYLRDLRTVVLNASYDLLTAEDAKAAWVTNALEDEKVTPDAAKAAFEGKFGKGAVIYDPTDPEANKIAMSQGLPVVPGGSLPKAAWGNIKTHGIASPAGQVTPSPQVSDGDVPLMNPAHWPADVARVSEFTRNLAKALLNADVEVRITKANAQRATYQRTGHGHGILTFYIGSLGFKWFGRHNTAAQIDLIIHELGHHNGGSDHLDRKYINALTSLGAQMTMLALDVPAFFDSMTTTTAAAA